MFAAFLVNLMHSLKCAICCFSNNEKLPYNALFKLEKKIILYLPSMLPRYYGQTLWLAVIIRFVYNKRLVQLLVCDFACVCSSGDSSSGFPFG